MPHDVLDTPLARLTPWDNFYLRDAVQGVSILGGVGSGKTSGSGHVLASAYLRAGMGGLVMCAKPEEVTLWRQYCAENGRSASLIEFDPSQGFNFLAYELARQGSSGVNAVIEVLMRVLELARAASPTPPRGGDAFWEDTTKQILRHAVPVLYAATGTVDVSDLLRFVRSAPRAPDEMRNPEWQRGSFFCECFVKAANALPDEVGDRLVAYWQHDFAALDAKTRGNILISLTTTLDRFNHGWLRSAFCGRTTMVPEMTFHGAVIVLALPALTYNEDGILGQQIWKMLWQRVVLSRNGLDQASRARPVFLWADEAQYFLADDAQFLSTCRASRCCTVFLSQSLPTYYAKIGGDNARDRAHHLLSNFATKIWHNSGGCAETAEWAAKTVGRTIHWRENRSTNEGSNSGWNSGMNEGSNSGGNSGSGGGFSYSGNGQGQVSSNHSSGSSWGESEGRSRGHSGGTSRGSSRGVTEQMDFLIEPGAFGALKTGGPINGNRVSAIWYQAGRRFQTSNSNVLLLDFAQ